MDYTFETPHSDPGFSFPYTVKLLGLAAFKAVARGYTSEPNVDLEKLEGLVRSIVNGDTVNEGTGQRPTLGLCPKIRAKPFWEAEDAEFFERVERDLKANIDVIRDEYSRANRSEAQLTSTYHGSTRYQSLPPDAWLGFTIVGLEGLYPQDKRASRLFPATASIVKELGRRVCGAEFLVLKPGTVLPPHTDGVNVLIACQMGIIVAGDCALRVKDSTREIAEKKVVFFDQSFPHSAWNKSESPRVVLLLSLVHPDITDAEIDVTIEVYRALKRRVLIFLPIVGIDVVLSYLMRRVRKAMTPSD
jgi:hypothetical protein